jgi:hypothetical protein
VDSNEKVFDAAGQQIAEFDLIISGNLGSSSVRWLIECRDRPSQGAAPGSWIQQLVGRKQQFKFDKVFAVSTTGFSAAAISAAEYGNVILRAVQTFGEIKTDFKILGFAFNFEETEFVGPINGELEDPNMQLNVDIKRPMIRRVGELQFQPFPVFVSRNRVQPPATDGGIELLYFHCDGWVEVLIGEQPVRIKDFRVPLQIKHKMKTSKALFGRVYSEGDKTIWAEASFEAESHTGKIKSRMQIYRHSDRQMSARFFNDEIPDGFYVDSIRIFGWNKVP